MDVFGWRKPSEAQLAFKRTEALLRADYAVDKISESDWMFAPPGHEHDLLLTMWAFNEGDPERPAKQAPFAGLIWDIAWYVERGKLGEGQVNMVRAAAGRGTVEAQPARLLKRAQLFFYERLVTPMHYDEEAAKAFLRECVSATQRMQKAMLQP
jgi:hypothetical protein